MTDKNSISIGKSFDAVIRETAIKIAGDYFLEHSERMVATISNCTGQPIDIHSKEVPPELKIYMNAFSSGVGCVLAAILTGKLDLYVMKKEINAAAAEDIDKEPTP